MSMSFLAITLTACGTSTLTVPTSPAATVGVSAVYARASSPPPGGILNADLSKLGYFDFLNGLNSLTGDVQTLIQCMPPNLTWNPTAGAYGVMTCTTPVLVGPNLLSAVCAYDPSFASAVSGTLIKGQFITLNGVLLTNIWSNPKQPAAQCALYMVDSNGNVTNPTG